MSVVAVIAKAPMAGRSKTRLCPPCSPDQAAAVALAALEDTLDAARLATCARRVLVLDGEPDRWAEGFEVIPQRGDGLAERLAAAFEDIDAVTFLVGMDTPQLTTTQLQRGLDALMSHDASFGPAVDGGYWGIGLRSPRSDALLGVPMSTTRTGDAQLERLRSLGLSVAVLGALQDVDHWTDAVEVARALPGTRFAEAVGVVASTIAPGPSDQVGSIT